MYSSGFIIIIPDKTTISVTSWHQMDTRFVLDSGHPAYIRGPASIRTSDQDPWLLFETWLVLEVLWYLWAHVKDFVRNHFLSKLMYHSLTVLDQKG